MAEPQKRVWPVRITTLGPIRGGTVAFVEGGVTYVTVVVKATFALVHEAFAVQTAPEELVLAEELQPGSQSVERASDLAPFVPAVDVLVRGRAHGDGGTPVPAVATRLVMTSSEMSGAEVLIDKTVHVYGRRERAGAYPESFASFPLVYDFSERPSADASFGVGAGEVPNLVLPNGERGYAGFGPIAATWADRQSFLDDASIDPTDVDGARVLSLRSESETGAFPFEYFQVAPPDQRLTGLEGGEWIVLDGMHRDLPRFATKLPHMRAEAQLYDPEGRPLPMHLVCDTLSIDMEARTLNALFRGNIPAPAGPLDALSVVATLEVLANEDLDRSVSSFGSGASFADLAAEERVASAPPTGLEDTPLPDPPRTTAPPIDDPASDGGVSTAILVAPRFDGASSANEPSSDAPRKTVPPPAAPAGGDIPFRAGARAAVPGPQSSGGLPFAPRVPAFASEQTPSADSPADAETTTGLPFLTRTGTAPPAMAADDSSDDEPPTRMRASAPPPDPAKPPPLQLVPPPRVMGPATAPPPAAASAPPRAADPAPPPPGAALGEAKPVAPPVTRDPTALDAPTTIDENDVRAVVLRKLAKGEALYDANYAGADLSGVDFRGAALTGIQLTNAKLEKCCFDGARLASAKLSGADLRGATFVGAELGQADLSKCKLAGARFDDARVDDALFALVDAQGASFVKASGQRVALAQGQFHDAKFDGASLPSADFSGADLAGASFEGASLSSARFADARGKGVRFDRAEMDQATFVGAHFEEASFAGASLRTASLERARFEGCAFSGAKLGKAILARSTLDRCSFTGADADGANFISATGQGGDFDGATLTGADLRQTKLGDVRFEKADLRRVNAHKASLVGARFDRANLGGASLRGAKLRGASLEGADLADADLRDADLEGARLVGILNRDRAKLGGANLKGAEDDAAPKDGDGDDQR